MKSTALILSTALLAAAYGHTTTCATFVTSDLALTNDLIGCPDQGLIVSSAGSITIKLNGHTISGLPGSSSGIGVANSTDVVIIGPGAIKGFTAGVAIQNSNSIRVENVELVGNYNNVYTVDSIDGLIQGSSLRDGANGILIDGVGVGFANRVINNEIVNNSINGVMLRGVSLSEIGDNYFKNNGVGTLISGADRNLIIGNAFVSNTTGVKLDITAPGAAGADRNRVESNKFLYNDNGIVSQAFAGGAHRNRYNRFQKNHIYNGGTGINVDGSKNIKTRVLDNTIIRMSVDYIADTGTATLISGNTCTPGPC